MIPNPTPAPPPPFVASIPLVRWPLHRRAWRLDVLADGALSILTPAFKEPLVVPSNAVHGFADPSQKPANAEPHDEVLLRSTLVPFLLTRDRLMPANLCIAFRPGCPMPKPTPFYYRELGVSRKEARAGLLLDGVLLRARDRDRALAALEAAGLRRFGSLYELLRDTIPTAPLATLTLEAQQAARRLTSSVRVQAGLWVATSIALVVARIGVERTSSSWWFALPAVVSAAAAAAMSFVVRRARRRVTAVLPPEPSGARRG